LLLLSDGRPNDCDRYAGRHGFEDARQALVEARMQGLTPYCFTVDRNAETYVPMLFGVGRYTTVRHARQLPLAFVEWLRRAAREAI
jgi:nitric oxide reductase NorD protein